MTLSSMTTLLSPDTIGAVTSENPWQRLHRIADARRRHLHLTVDGIKGAGGPSAPWFYALKKQDGPVSNRHVPFLNALDVAMQWPAGTSVRLLELDRSEWSDAVLEDEELSLVEGEDEIGGLAYAVERMLRAMPPVERERAMREIGRVIGLPVVGD